MVRAGRRLPARKLHEKLLGQLLGPLILACGIFYFTFHALSGERGIYALLKEERKLEVVNAELADVRAKRKELENHVRDLGDGSLDLDLLDERARVMLNESGEDEVVIPLKDTEASEVPKAN